MNGNVNEAYRAYGNLFVVIFYAFCICKWFTLNERKTSRIKIKKYSIDIHIEFPSAVIEPPRNKYSHQQ